MIYKCYCVGEKNIIGKNGKQYTLLWITLYNDNEEFIDCVKLLSNKSLKGVELGVVFKAEKGFNRETRETFLYNIDFTDFNNSISTD